jgi:hypothetical protein
MPPQDRPLDSWPSRARLSPGRPDTDALYAFVIDRLTERAEVADVNTSIVYAHIRRPVLEAVDNAT